MIREKAQKNILIVVELAQKKYRFLSNKCNLSNKVSLLVALIATLNGPRLRNVERESPLSCNCIALSCGATQVAYKTTSATIVIEY